MTIKRPRNQKNMNKPFPARGIEDIRQHCALQLLGTNFSRKPVMLHKHTTIAVGTEPLSAVVTSRIDDKTGSQQGELTTIKNQKEIRGAQMNRQMEVEINDENEKKEIGRSRFD